MAQTMVIEGNRYVERSVVAPVLLSIVTLGVYGAVWYYSVNKELYEFTGLGGPVVSLLAMLLGWLLLFIPTLISIRNTAERIQAAQVRSGIAATTSPKATVWLAVLPIACLFWQFNIQRGQNRWIAREVAVGRGRAI